MSLLHGSTGFGEDVASGAAKTARNLGFEVQKVRFEPSHATEAAATLPSADLLLVVGGFEARWGSGVAVGTILGARQRRCEAAHGGAGRRLTGRKEVIA